MSDLLGMHHVTAIAGDPQQNIDFYRGILGLRLVKVTVNFDDPEAYHLYYGDGVGHPGTILTFFAWPNAALGVVGAGQTGATTFTIASDAVEYWAERLAERGITASRHQRFGETVLAFQDHDGLALELATSPMATERPGWTGSDIPAEHVIRGLHGVTLHEARIATTAEMLTRRLGFQLIGEEDGTQRYAVAQGAPGAIVDLHQASGRGLVAVGTVHHVAWRAADSAAQLQWREQLIAARQSVTPVLDRQYFHSIYFREPGGVLFEIATDPPGFTIDEPVAELGTHLKLPPWLEEQRPILRDALAPLRNGDVEVTK
jgi:glyoxalase family protein